MKHTLIMAIPPLKMNKADVETTICRTFKRKIKQLQFNKALSFSAVDSDGDNSFFLQREFDGEGKYRVRGCVKLWDLDHIVSRNYTIETSVMVTANHSEPQITFDESITATQSY